jgi:hypothetical protein
MSRGGGERASVHLDTVKKNINFGSEPATVPGLQDVAV